jgi:integrase
MKAIRSRRATRRARARAARKARPGTGTVGEYLARWVDAKQSLRPSTRLSYATHIRLYLVPHLGHIALAELRPHHLEAMYRSLASDPDLRDPVGPATLARVHATLISALGTAVRRGLIDRNPAETVELPTPCRPEFMVWTAEQLSQFLGGVVDDDLYPVFVLLALCGLRRGEAVGLRWRDVDLESGVLRVRQQLIAVGRHIVVVSRRPGRVTARSPSTSPPCACCTATGPLSSANGRRSGQHGWRRVSSSPNPTGQRWTRHTSPGTSTGSLPGRDYRGSGCTTCAIPRRPSGWPAERASSRSAAGSATPP